MRRAVLLFGVPNALFSAAMVQHSSSLGIGLVYLLVAPLLLLAVLRVVRPVDERWARWLLVGFFLVAAALFAVVYPIADARKVVGGGTDADDALDLAVRALLRGEYPYLQRTYLNNPITPLPGWIVLAAPFVALFGRAAYLNVFWLGVWLLVLVRVARWASVALVLAILTFVLFPGVSITYLNGSDSFASVVAISVLVVAVGRVPWPVLAVLAGVVLSSRFNVVLVLPILAALAGRNSRRSQDSRRSGFDPVGPNRAGAGALSFGGPNRAAGGVLSFGGPNGAAGGALSFGGPNRVAGVAFGFGALAGVVWVAVSFAPWLVDASDFTPLHTYGMLGRFDSVVPHFGLVVPALTGLLAVRLAWMVLRAEVDAWLAMALVLSVPVVVDFVAEVALARQLDLWPLVYGLMATPLWVNASVPAVASVLSQREAEAQPPFWRLAARSASASRS